MLWRIRCIGWKIINYLAFNQADLQLLPNQGHCNLNYLLEKEGKKYLVRKFRLSDRDRKLEFRIQKLASKKGLGAKPLYLDEAIMIGEFVEGVHKKKLSKKETRALALALKKLHKIPFRAKPIFFKKSLEKKFTSDFALCHNDLNSKNILFAKSVKFIDWEYAGVADRYFDLATVCEEFALDEVCFFRAYGEKIDKKKLLVYKKIYREVTVAWFAKLRKGELCFLL